MRTLLGILALVVFAGRAEAIEVVSARIEGKTLVVSSRVQITCLSIEDRPELGKLEVYRRYEMSAQGCRRSDPLQCDFLIRNTSGIASLGTACSSPRKAVLERRFDLSAFIKKGNSGARLSIVGEGGGAASVVVP